MSRLPPLSCSSVCRVILEPSFSHSFFPSRIINDGGITSFLKSFLKIALIGGGGGEGRGGNQFKAVPANNKRIYQIKNQGHCSFKGRYVSSMDSFVRTSWFTDIVLNYLKKVP